MRFFIFNSIKLVGSNQILSIKNISFETLGVFKKYLLSDGYLIKEVKATKKSLLNENPLNYDAVFILGGPMSVNDDYDYLRNEKNLIKNFLENGVPVMGICLGSQLIASVCGGQVYPGSKKEIGWSDVVITPPGKKSLFHNIGKNKIRVFQWHGDTFTLPSGAEVLSTSDLYIQAFRYKNAFGVQFHLEVTRNLIKKWISKYQRELEAEKIDKSELINHMDEYLLDLQDLSTLVYKNFISFLK